MEKLLKQLETALDKHNEAYFYNPEEQEIAAERVYAISERLACLELGSVYIKAPSGKMRWFDLYNYDFN